MKTPDEISDTVADEFDGLYEDDRPLAKIAKIAREVAKAHEGEIRTHSENCWKRHAGCLALVILEIAEGEA